MDPLELLTRAPFPFLSRCRVPEDLESVTVRGEEARARGTTRDAVRRVWNATEALYRTGVHPAIQLCVRHRGRVVLSRAIGHARGNAPDDPPDAEKVPVGIDTPFCLYSASKAITAMVIHKLDEERVLHLDDRVCDYIPDFASHGKQWITIRHVLAHRAGIPNVPREAMDLDMLEEPEAVADLLCDSELTWRPGQLVAYHAISGGFVLGEVVRRATGQDIRQVLEKEILAPLDMRWMRYGVAPADVGAVAVDAFTGPPPPPPVGTLLVRALGASMREIVELATDPRFLTGIVPSANTVSNAEELCAFYQCLLNEGELDGVRVFDPRTVWHAVSEQSYREIDLTLMIPLRYGLGLMLGDDPIGIFGPRTPRAFGHLGFTNIWGWADPERQLAVAILTSGKPVLSLHAVRLVQLMIEINAAFPRRA